MNCTKCGTEVEDGVTICPNCGESLATETPTTNSQDTQTAPAPVGFILGLVSIVAWIIPLFGYPVTICGIVFSAKQIKSPIKSAKTMAIVGLVLSIIFLLVTMLNSFIGMIIGIASAM